MKTTTINPELLSTRQTYKMPESQLGKNLISVIERECKTAKVRFYLTQNKTGLLQETIYLGVRDAKEFVRLIDFFGFYKYDVKVKTIEAKEEENNFYLLTVNNAI